MFSTCLGLSRMRLQSNEAAFSKVSTRSAASACIFLDLSYQVEVQGAQLTKIAPNYELARG